MHMKHLSESNKSERLLYIYSRLVNGEYINKADLAAHFQVTNRSIQRDIEALRCFFTEQYIPQEIVYDKKIKGYRLEAKAAHHLTNSEIFSVCKILLESRSMVKEEIMPMIDTLLYSCVSTKDRTMVNELISNERLHYIEPHHGKRILGSFWELGQAASKHFVIEIEYQKMKENEIVCRRLEPVGLFFSEYYFYLVGFIRGIDKEKAFRNPDDLFPTIYRVDRIKRFTVTKEKFIPVYKNRFEEGEFRKRVQFMYGGKLRRIKFKYTGLSVEAILDRLPTAEIVQQDEEGYVITAEVFGDGVDMWLRSQGESVYVIKEYEQK